MPLVFHLRSSQQSGLNFETSFRYRKSASQVKVGDMAVIHARTSLKGRYRYVGFAEVANIIEDTNTDCLQAILRNYLNFPLPMPPRRNGISYERPLHGLRRIRDHHSEQQAVRPLAGDDFLALLRDAFGDLIETGQQQYAEPEPSAFESLLVQETRRIVDQISRRPVRDSANRRIGLRTYPKGCAITGDILSTQPGTTLCEVHHIVPVADRGPDSIRNLILLSPSAHRAWDSGLISLADDGRVLRSPRLKASELLGRFDRAGYAWLPAVPSLRPASAFLRWHRENRFLAT